VCAELRGPSLTAEEREQRARLAERVAGDVRVELGAQLRFPQDDAAALAARVRELYELGASGRAALGARLRERVCRDHSVEHWADEVLAAAR